MIDHDPVVLLGHPAVVGPQSRLDVTETDADGVRGERGRERRVRVALDDDVLRLEPGDRLGDLLGTAPDLRGPRETSHVQLEIDAADAAGLQERA